MDKADGRTGYKTRAQEELFAYFRETPGVHHTANELKAYFAHKGTPIGTATIYRQLERFVEEGRIHKYFMGTGESACYALEETAEACSSHFHCKCELCGSLIHLECEEMKEMQEHLLDHHGFAWNPGKTVFYGLCDQCRKA